MTEEITTAEELDALPLHSVILDRHGWAHQSSEWGPLPRRRRWLSIGNGVIRDAAAEFEYGNPPFRVIYRAPEPEDAA